METKFIVEGPDKKGRTHIIEVEEDAVEKIRYVKRFICEVCHQETQAQTALLAYEIVQKLSSK